MTDKQYWHELSQQERKQARDTKTNMEVVTTYQQPKWCSLYNALDYYDGCWSLLLEPDSVNEKFCSCLSTEEGIATCDFYKGVTQDEL